MPAPFPGMDPFIEGQKWRDFHTSMIVVLREFLTPRVTPRYVVDIEESVYLQQESDEPDQVRYPDLSILEGDTSSPPRQASSSSSAVAIEPIVHTVPKPRTRRQRFLEIRERLTRRVVTVIEVLSPTNKTDGFRQYLAKRAELFSNPVHLVELDLLRGGRRLPTVEPLHPADYYAFVIRHERLPKVAVYGWPLRHVLPTIPVPLQEEDPDVPIDLQGVFTTVYDRAGYRYSLDYASPVISPLNEADAAWVAQMLDSWRPPDGPEPR
jgi:hypothetical protein